MTPYRDSQRRPMSPATPPRWRRLEAAIRYVLGKVDDCLTMKMRFMELAIERQPFNVLLIALLLALEAVVAVLFVIVMCASAVVVVGACINEDLRSIRRGLRGLRDGGVRGHKE